VTSKRGKHPARKRGEQDGPPQMPKRKAKIIVQNRTAKVAPKMRLAKMEKKRTRTKRLT